MSATQKVIITLADGRIVTFTGPAQVDTSKPIKVKKFQFTKPKEESSSDFGDDIFALLAGRPKR